MKKRSHAAGLTLGVLGVLAGGAAQAATPDLVDVRLGAREGAVTRVVLDLRGGDAPFTYSLSEDGRTISIVLKAKGHAPALPHPEMGLVRGVAAAAQRDGTHISISAATPVSVITTGKLAPEGGYRFHRIYLDLSPSTQSPAAIPMPERHPVESVSAESSHPEMTQTEAPHAEMAEPPSEAHHDHGTSQEGHGEALPEREPVVTIKIGGSFERSVSDYTNSGGPTAALETGLLHDALEMELGTTPLFRDGQTTWKSGLILKKSIELSENLEFELGGGPIWLHRTNRADDETPTDSAGVEGVLELVYWLGEHHSLGFYGETGYSYDFGKGHEKAAGAGAGMLIPLP